MMDEHDIRLILFYELNEYCDHIAQEWQYHNAIFIAERTAVINLLRDILEERRSFNTETRKFKDDDE